jgi:hypothetical protein
MFTGERYKLTFNGSFNGNEDLQSVPAGDFAMGSRNLDIHNGGAEVRGGTQKVGSQIAASLKSLGGGILVKRSTGTIHTYCAGDDGKLYRNGTSIETGRSTSEKTTFNAIDDEMYICNRVSIPRVDTGTAIANITTVAADWTGSAYPTKIIVHAKNLSRRAVAWGVPGHENTLYLSSQGNFKQFATGTSLQVEFSGIRDGHGIVDCVSKDGTLWVFGRSQTFILYDDDSSTANWGHYPASFKGGVHSPQLTCVVNNQIFVMNTEGDIYEVQTAQQLRDFKQASIAEPFWIHNYIRSEIDLTKIDQFHMAYDPKIKALRIFLVRTGQTTVDTSIGFLVNQGKWIPPHDAQDNPTASGFKAAASYEAEISTGAKKLYTQDYNGYTWELSSVTKTDDGNGYKAETYSGSMDFDLSGEEKRYVFGQLHYKSRGDYIIKVVWFIDEVQQTSRTVSLSASSAVLGSFILDTDTLSVIGISSREFETGQIGQKMRISINNNTVAGADFFLSHIIFAFVKRGVQRD